MKQNCRRIRFIKAKNKAIRKGSKISNIDIRRKGSGVKVLEKKKNRFKIQKHGVLNELNYDVNTNYFNEYWKMYYENEYILAKIKETVYEINAMKAHLKELKNYEIN